MLRGEASSRCRKNWPGSSPSENDDNRYTSCISITAARLRRTYRLGGAVSSSRQPNRAYRACRLQAPRWRDAAGAAGNGNTERSLELRPHADQGDRARARLVHCRRQKGVLQLLFEILRRRRRRGGGASSVGKRMMPLALTGSAITVTGAQRSSRRMLLRLRAPRWVPASTLDERDGALVRDQEDLAVARARGFKTAIFSEKLASSGEDEDFDTIVRLGPPFGHLGDGDLIGLDPGSRRLRVLFRHASKHNAFLVTERCNHYCLMCSQPPRNIDDG